MIFRILTILLLLAFVQSGSASSSTIIINANLLSPERTAILGDAWVKIDQGTIAAIGTGQVDTSGFDVIDAAGRYLIPGLIDSHVHLYHATGLRRRYSKDFDALYAEYMEQQPRSFLYFGFTTIIELNADAGTNTRFQSAILHPRLVHCGQGVILSDGFMALELEGEPIEESYPGYLIDHYANGRVPPGADPTQHTPSAAVDYVLSQGGRCIKLYFEEALWWPGGAPPFRLPSVAIARDVVSAAHAQGVPVILHATTPSAHRFALESGVDMLAHGMWEWPEQAFDAAVPNAAYQQVADDVSASGIGLQATFSTIRNTASLFMPILLEDQDWRHAVPARYLEYLRTDAQAQRDDFIERFGSQLKEGQTVRDLPGLMAAFASRYEKLIGRMHSNKATLLFGTDTAVGGFGWASPPGLAGYWEMQAWNRAGIPLPALFESLTIGNARSFGLDQEVGSIEVGKRADLLLLRENPLADVAAYNSIDLVFLNGQSIQRKALSAQSVH